jgi:hypothetical protein
MTNEQATYENLFKRLLDETNNHMPAVQTVFRDMRGMLAEGELVFSERMSKIISDYACKVNSNFVSFHVPTFVASLAVGARDNVHMTLETLRRVVASTEDDEVSASALYAASSIYKRMPEVADLDMLNKFSEVCEKQPKKKGRLRELFDLVTPSHDDRTKIKKAFVDLENSVKKALLQRHSRKENNNPPSHSL